MALDVTFANHQHDVARLVVAALNPRSCRHLYQFVALLGGEFVESDAVHHSAQWRARSAAAGLFAFGESLLKFAHRCTRHRVPVAWLHREPAGAHIVECAHSHYQHHFRHHGAARVLRQFAEQRQQCAFRPNQIQHCRHSQSEKECNEVSECVGLKHESVEKLARFAWVGFHQQLYGLVRQRQVEVVR